MSDQASNEELKASDEKVEKDPAEGTERKGSSSKCCPEPPCTPCTLLRCKTNSPSATCAPCSFLSPKPSPCCPPSPLCPPRCPPSPLCCPPRCPPSPLCCPPRCPPSPLCCPPRCPPSSLCPPRCPPCILPPRCFRCCEVTGSSSVLPKKSYCEPPIFPLPKCDPCSVPRYKIPCLPECDPCRPKCDPCRPKCDTCPPKCDPCLPKCDPCCPPPCCPEKKEEPKEEPKEDKTATPPKTPVPDDPCPKSPPPVHRCPSDVEAERPKYFIESITGDYTWQNYGVRIQFTDPISPGVSAVKLGTPLTVKLGIEVKENSCLSADIISAYMWTHMKTNCNPCGTWRDLPLHYQPDQNSVGECGIKRFVYSSTLTPTENDTFRLTFNIKWGNYMIWANNFGDDNMVGVGDR